jgi:hypothetical protein
MQLALPWCFFDPEKDPQQLPERVEKHAAETVREERLFCAHCQHVITHQRERCDVRGSHEHSCTNPLGLTFHIACFSRAPGCATSGGATHEHTWFPGYAWTIALCARCQTHLGWRFQAAQDEFYALVLARLTSRGAT